MAIVFWDSSLETGVDVIDIQHRQLFEMINRLHEKNEDPDADRVAFLATLDRMEQYARFHFSEEEALMQQAGYPALEEHRGKHEEFRQRIETLQQQSGEGDLRELFSESLGFLVNWLIRHVRQEDRQYIPYLKRHDA